MAKTGSNEIFERLVFRENLVAKEHGRSPSARALQKTRTNMAEFVRDVGKSGDFDRIIAFERRFLENDLAEHITSSAQNTSITTSLTELNAALKTRQMVNDPEQYAAVDANHGHTKARSGGLPKDDMRLFLSSQNSRLLNMDKSRLSEPEKKIITARRANIQTAQKIYIGMQRETLGLAKPTKDREQGLER